MIARLALVPLFTAALACAQPQSRQTAVSKSAAAKAGAQSRNLEIYWIDVEGGAATLVVSPSGESMLIDTGWEARDANRIQAAAKQAGLSKIDYLVISHFHADHAGGVEALSKLMPVGRYFTRSADELEPQNRKWLDSVRAASGGKQTIVKAGDRIPIQGIDALVVASDGRLIGKPLAGGGPNGLCADAENKAPAGPENQRMVGVMVGYNRFKFLDLIDLDWEKEMELACPVNRLGKVTVYQTGRHGSFDDAGAPAFLGAIAPQIVVVNNGPRKGMGQIDNQVKSATAGAKPYERNAYLRLAGLPGIEGIWQVHKSLLDADPKHNTSEDMIANLEETAECKGNWIKASISRDGKATLTNGRNGFSKTYQAQ
jgi:competence protein ComEC